jgi:hypothetical protein
LGSSFSQKTEVEPNDRTRSSSKWPVFRRLSLAGFGRPLSDWPPRIKTRAANRGHSRSLYDVDDDGRVGFGDLAVFATAFQQIVGTPGAEFAWACDFDHWDQVDVGDLAFFAENFWRTPGDPIVCPGDFPDDWRNGTQQASGLAEFAAARRFQAADRASLHDSALEACSDGLDADENQGPLSNELLRYACCLLDFDAMAAASTSSNDTKDVAETVDFLVMHGYWEHP